MSKKATKKKRVYCGECKHGATVASGFTWAVGAREGSMQPQYEYKCTHPLNKETRHTAIKPYDVPKWNCNYKNRNNDCKLWEQHVEPEPPKPKEKIIVETVEATPDRNTVWQQCWEWLNKEW